LARGSGTFQSRPKVLAGRGHVVGGMFQSPQGRGGVRGGVLGGKNQEGREGGKKSGAPGGQLGDGVVFLYKAGGGRGKGKNKNLGWAGKRLSGEQSWWSRPGIFDMVFPNSVRPYELKNQGLHW